MDEWWPLENARHNASPALHSAPSRMCMYSATDESALVWSYPVDLSDHHRSIYGRYQSKTADPSGLHRRSHGFCRAHNANTPLKRKRNELISLFYERFQRDLGCRARLIEFAREAICWNERRLPNEWRIPRFHRYRISRSVGCSGQALISRRLSIWCDFQCVRLFCGVSRIPGFQWFWIFDQREAHFSLAAVKRRRF